MSTRYDEQARAASRARTIAAKKPTSRENAIADRAVILIAPREKKRRACRLAVLRAMYSIPGADVEREWIGLEKTKHGKKAARMLGLALRRVERTSQNEQLPLRLNPFTLLKLIALAEQCEAIATAKSGKSEKDGPIRYDAAAHAYRLLKEYGEEKRIPAHDKSSKFCKLAALILNDSKANLTRQCKAYKAYVLRRDRNGALAGTKKVS